MRSRRKTLLIFMRYPQAGQVKFRLAAAIGSPAAAAVYEKLVRRTLGMVSDFHRRFPKIDIVVFFTPPERYLQMTRRYPGPWEFIPQHGTHLGHKMANAFHLARARGSEQVVIIGSDLADIEADDLHDAFTALDTVDAVLNPAADGGFYLLGLNRPCPAVFAPENWGTPHIFSRTRQLLRKAGLTVRSLRQRHDVDRPEDLPHFDRQLLFRDRLSVVIPTLGAITDLRPLLTTLSNGLWPEDEIIVAGPRVLPTFTAREPMRFSDSCLGVTCPPGRGVQLNSGVRHAGGQLLWFLHDDSIVPPHFAYLVRNLCGTRNKSLGCFQLAFSTATPMLNAIACWGNWRTRFLQLPYGDQGLFCRRETFDTVGGFHRFQLMEDVDFVKRCRRHGGILMLAEKLYTSPRRYLAKGILRASLRNHLTMFLYHMGCSEQRLHDFYYR